MLILKLLAKGGRCAIVLPDGSLFGEGVKTRIKERLLRECDLHTIVRLPNGVFALHRYQHQLGIISLDEAEVGEWIKTHTDRDHFHLDANQSKFLLNLLEAFLHGRLRPWFER